MSHRRRTVPACSTCGARERVEATLQCDGCGLEVPHVPHDWTFIFSHGWRIGDQSETPDVHLCPKCTPAAVARAAAEGAKR